MEATEKLNPKRKVSLVSKEAEHFDRPLLFSILAMEYSSNNIGVQKAIKWVSSALEIWEDETTSAYKAYSDLGQAVYRLDISKLNDEEITLQGFYNLLTLDCAGISSDSFSLIKEKLLVMSALERKWFIRYWLKISRNGINEGLVKKMVAKYYDKKLSEVKTHTNFNSIFDTCTYYEMKEEPPTNLSHGRFVKPMLAKELPMKDWPKNKIVDYKYDGNRYQIHKEGDNVIIFNRKGAIVTPQFQDVVERVIEYNVHSCILDGEIYPIKEDGSPAEHKLMATRVHSKNHEEAREKVQVEWVIFDCLKFGKDTIMNLPYSDRIIAAKTLPDQAHRMEDGDILAFYNRAINDGFEGIIVKDATLPYEAGKRSKGWAKYKPPRIEVDVVITSAKYGEGKRGNVFASFDIAVKGDSDYISVGSVGTGFTEAELLMLTNKLRTTIEKYDNGVYHFLPRVVLEVSADLVTKDKHGNVGLRFPRMKRIRDDKFASDINTEDDLERWI